MEKYFEYCNNMKIFRHFKNDKEYFKFMLLRIEAAYPLIQFLKLDEN